MKEHTLKATDGYQLSLSIFEAENPKAVIQVMHGMEEYQKRYEYFANKMVEAGYTVVTADMRGHGPKAKQLGYFADHDGYKYLIQDQRDITAFIQKTYPGLPTYIFAHSMGTITARILLMSDSSNYQKVVLSGFPHYNSAAGMGIAICNIIQAIKGPMYKSNLVKGMVFGAFAKAVPNRLSDLDWLSYNHENVNQYENDKLCGYGFTISGYRDLFVMTKMLKSYKKYHDVNTNLDVLMISGVDDPVTGGERWRKHSLQVLEKAGFNVKKEIAYPHMRHEILNEDAKETVIEEIINFYNYKL